MSFNLRIKQMIKSYQRSLARRKCLQKRHTFVGDGAVVRSKAIAGGSEICTNVRNFISSFPKIDFSINPSNISKMNSILTAL